MASAPDPVTASATRPVDVALQTRAAARLRLMRGACYTGGFSFGKASDAVFRRADSLVSCSAVNFVTGEHFHPGAESWRDLHKASRDLFQTFVNAYAHNTRLKDVPAKKASNLTKPPYMHGRMVLETLVSLTYDEVADKTVHTVTGYRPWFFHAANRTSFAEFFKSLQLARGGKKRAAATQPAGGQKKKKKKKARKDGDEEEEEEEEQEQEEEEEQAANTATAAAAALETDSFSPLAFGLGASFQESNGLLKRIEETRAAAVKRKATEGRRRRGPEPAPTAEELAARPLVLQNIDAANIMAFQYLHATSDVDFHLRDVVSYVRPERYAVTPQEDGDPAAHELVDPRPFINYSMRDANDDNLPYYHRKNIINPDNIFTKESAMAYFTYSATGDQLVCDEQTDLANYAHGVENDPDAELAATLGNMRMDGADAHRTKLVRDIAKGAADSVPPNFPFPSLVFLVNNNMATPESMALARLPFPIGHKLTADDLEGDANPSPEEASEWARCINGLRIYEDELHRTQLKRNPSVPKQGIIAGLRASIQASGNPADISSILSEMHVAVPELPPTQMKTVLAFQQNVIDRFLAEEASRIKTKPHDLLFVQQTEKDSMDDHMGMMDLLPTSFVFHKNRMHLLRENVEAFLRERYFVHLDTLSPDERREADQVFARNVQALVKSLSETVVDDIPMYFTENDMILQLHQKFQAQQGILTARVMDHLDAQKAVLEGAELKDELIRVQNGYRFSLEELRGTQADETIETLKTSETIADVLKSPDFRTWYLKNCTPAVMEALGAAHPVLSQDAKPFNIFMQELADHLFVDANVRSPGLQGAMLMIFTALESQIWLLYRLEPAGNTIFFGASGVGKSHLARAVMRMLVPGLVKNLSTFSAQAFTTTSNMDNIWFVQEEGKASLLAPTKEDAERGGSNELNQTKDRQTRFCSTSQRAWIHPETGKATTITSISSAHNSTTTLTNMYQHKVDSAYARRSVFVTQPGLRGDVGHSAEKNQKLSTFNDESSSHEGDRRWQLTMAMYTTIKTLQKAAVIPECDTTNANMLIVSVLKELGVSVSATELHRFVQFAMDYQLFYAAHMVCWSPYQAKYHSDPNAPARWSGHAIVNLVQPFLIASPEATVLSLTALAFTVVPTHIDSFLKDLVKELHLHEPARIVYRRVDSPDRGQTPTSYDTNYVALEGYNEEQIIDSVTARNTVYVLRSQDVISYIEVLNKSLTTGKNYVVAENGTAADGRPLHVVRDEASEVVSLLPFISEKMAATGKGGKKYRVCVSIEFLVTYFKVNFNNTAAWAKIEEKPVSITERTFTMEKATRLAFVEPGHSAMVRAIDRVLSNRTFNKSPMEDPTKGLPDVCNEFITALSPNPLRIGIDVPQAGGTTRRHDYRANLHGVLLKTRFERDLNRPGITRENSHILPPTVAERFLLRNETARMDDHQKWQYANSSHLAYTFDEYDGAYVTGKHFLVKLGHVDAPCILKLAGFDDKAIECFADNKSTQKLPDALPIGFEPFGYMLQKAICREMNFRVGTVLYPEDTIYDELHNSMLVERTKETPLNLRNPEEKKKIVDFYELAKTTPTARISFEGIDADKAFYERDLHSLMNLMSGIQEETDEEAPPAPPPPAAHVDEEEEEEGMNVW